MNAKTRRCFRRVVGAVMSDVNQLKADTENRLSDAALENGQEGLGIALERLRAPLRTLGRNLRSALERGGRFLLPPEPSGHLPCCVVGGRLGGEWCKGEDRLLQDIPSHVRLYVSDRPFRAAYGELFHVFGDGRGLASFCLKREVSWAP